MGEVLWKENKSCFMFWLSSPGDCVSCRFATHSHSSSSAQCGLISNSKHETLSHNILPDGQIFDLPLMTKYCDLPYYTVDGKILGKEWK